MIDAVHRFQNNITRVFVLFPVLDKTGADITVTDAALIILAAVEQRAALLHLRCGNAPHVPAGLLVGLDITLSVSDLLDFVHTHTP